VSVTGPLFKWFGSKWQSSARMPAPEYDLIVEPFAGGAGYSLRYSARKVILCETDKHLALLWPWLIQAKESEIREIPLGLPEGTDIRSVGLSPGQATLLKTWQRTNNVGDCWTISPWGNKPGQWTANTRARVAEESQLIKHWQFAGNAAEVFSIPDKRPCTWFVDPPYKFNYQYRQAPIDYLELGKVCRELEGQVLVCEARHPETQAAPDWLPFADLGSFVTSRRKKGEHTHSREMLWSNTCYKC